MKFIFVIKILFISLITTLYNQIILCWCQLSRYVPDILLKWIYAPESIIRNDGSTYIILQVLNTENQRDITSRALIYFKYNEIHDTEGLKCITGCSKVKIIYYPEKGGGISSVLFNLNTKTEEITGRRLMYGEILLGSDTSYDSD